MRRLHAQGVEAVERTIRQLYEMIEADDARIHRLVSSATAAQLKRIDELTARITHLDNEKTGIQSDGVNPQCLCWNPLMPQLRC